MGRGAAGEIIPRRERVSRSSRSVASTPVPLRGNPGVARGGRRARRSVDAGAARHDAVNVRFERILDALEGKLPAEGVDRTVSRDYSRLTVSSYVRGSHGRAGGA